MATIKVTDQLSAVIDTVGVHPVPGVSALEKYVTNPAVSIVLLPQLVEALKKPLAAAGEKPISLGLKFSNKVDFGASSNPELTISAEETQNVNVNARANCPLFATDFYGDPITVQAGEGWLSLGLTGSVHAGLAGTAPDLSFGIKAGGEVSSEYFRKYAVNAKTPILAEALGELLSSFTLPADVADLDAMGTGDIATIAGNGSLKITADVSVSASPNPLASATLPLAKETIAVKAAATLDVAASLEISGAYQIRARKLAPNSVELGFYRKKGAAWSVSLTPSVGLSAVVGKTDVLAKLMGALTGKAVADVKQELSQGGLSEEQIKKLESAIKSGMDASVKASIEMELAVADTNEAAFLYRVDTKGLDAVGSAAVHAALDGDLSELTALERSATVPGAIAPGVTMVRSSVSRTRDRKTTLKINLVGLLNFSSVFELIRKSQAIFEPVTGDLTINETVSGNQIDVLTEQDKLRRIKFHSLLVTTAYRASRTLGTVEATSSDVFFAFNQNTNEHTMSDYLDGVIGLGLLDAGGKAQLIESFPGSGPSTCLLRAEFNDNACSAMFLNGGQPRAQSEYERIGREVMKMLLQPGDGKDIDKYRRDILGDDALWGQLCGAGQPGFHAILPGLNAVQLEAVTTDFTTIEWWASSMASTGQSLAAMRKFIGEADPATLKGNNTFNSLRNTLQKHVAGVVAKSGLQFGLPFGLVALYRAAEPLGVPSALIVSQALTKRFAPALGARP